MVPKHSNVLIQVMVIVNALQVKDTTVIMSAAIQHQTKDKVIAHQTVEAVTQLEVANLKTTSATMVTVNTEIKSLYLSI